MLNNVCVFEELVFFDLWILDSGLRISDFGLRIADSGFRFPGFRVAPFFMFHLGLNVNFACSRWINLDFRFLCSLQ